MHDLEEYLSVLETVADRTVEFEEVTKEQSEMVVNSFFSFVSKVFPTLKPKLTSFYGGSNFAYLFNLNPNGNLHFNGSDLVIRKRDGIKVIKSSWKDKARWHSGVSLEEALPEIASALPYLLNLCREIVQVRQEPMIKAITEVKEVCAKALKEMRKLPIEEVS